MLTSYEIEKNETEYEKWCSILLPDYTEEVLVEDFRITTEKSGSGGIGGECSNVGEAYINASTSSVDGLVQPVSMMTKKVNVKTVVSRFKGRYVCLFAYLFICVFSK